MTYTVPPSVLPGNILTLADSDFETTGFTWAADTNANAPIRTNGGGGFVASAALSGSYALMWQATAIGDSIISTGFYPCSPSKGYDVSGGVLTITAGHNAFIGVRWYDSGHTHISDSWGKVNATVANVWQSQVAAVTSPANAAYMKVAVWVATTVLANEYFAIDLEFAAQVPAQVLIDWINPAFSAQSIAGSDFLDMTPWVRYSDNISVGRGRQNGISEISAGQAQFYVQNDTGWFTPGNTGSPIVTYGGTPGLGARCQINVPDQNGVWHTRFDGPVAEIDYAISPTAGTEDVASITCADVLASLSRQQNLQCWTKQAVLNSSPWLHWALDDPNNAGSLGNAAETSGNNGPVLHAIPSTTSASASIAWRNSNGGVETLADASSPGRADESEFWGPGNVVSTGVNALDPVMVGPYSTPLASAYFTPVITTGSFQDTFVGSLGYTLTGSLTAQTGFIAPTSVGANYAIEFWFSVDPNIWPLSNSNTGPFVAIGLGSTRTNANIFAGLCPIGGFTTVFSAGIMTQPGGFSNVNWGASGSGLPTGVHIVSTGLVNGETKPLVHHCVLSITGGTPATPGTVDLTLDNTDYGTFTLTPNGQVFDTITVGGAYGGCGCWYGNISLVSVYQRLLTKAEIQQHFQLGQYGMWEQTTDNCVAALGQYAGIPSFWNGLVGQSAGLSLADYFDISGSNALSAMQVYEQAEQGLLFVPANGTLQFSTRDWRMGYRSPDVNLPPDTYTSDLHYQLIDTYLVNQAAVSTQTYQKGVAWSNVASNSQYGTYANGTVGSPTSLPLITWNRAFSNLGLPAYNYWPDPCLNDNVAWQVNTRSAQRLIMGSLTVDLLTLDSLSGLTVSQLYAIDINNMVSLLSYDAMVLSYSPVSYYALDDGVGADLAGNGGTLTPSIGGLVAYGASPPPVVTSPSCAYLSNVGGVLTSTYAPSGGGNWSAECWVNLNGVSLSGTVFLYSSANTSGGDNAGFALYLSTNAPRAAFGNGTTFATCSASVLPLTGWHHLAATWNGTTITLYVDGQFASNASLSGTLAAAVGKTVTIGGLPGGSGDFFTGLIGQCALTPVAFTAAQVFARYGAAQNGQPAGFANLLGANELFIEGVTEVIGLQTHTLQFYTSPVSTQRAWIPGDPVYGRLGVTSRIGISQPDLSTPQAIGKDVSHDAGSPYWPPQFVTKPTGIYRLGTLAPSGTSATIAINSGTMRSYQGDALLVQIMCPAASTITVGPDTEGNTYTLASSVTLPSGYVQYVFVATNCAPMNAADTVPVTMSVSQQYTMSLIGIQNVSALDQVTTASGTSATASVTSGTMAVPYELEVTLAANAGGLDVGVPGGWTLGADFNPSSVYESVLWKQGSTAATDAFSGGYTGSVAWGAIMLTFRVRPNSLNNPSGNSRSFIGSLEIRGLHDTLATALHPPLAVAGLYNHIQTIPTGNNVNPVVVWDTIYTDSAAGFAAVPAYPNWYTCMVPGYYEIMGSIPYLNVSSGDVGTRTGYIAVAQQAAQAVAAGTANPTTVNSYVCPVGEQHSTQNWNIPTAVCPSTQVYLGLGDMVALCTTSSEGGNDTIENLTGAPQMSLRWCGYGTLNDQVMINSSLGGGGSVTQLPASGPAATSSGASAKRHYATSWTANATYSYYGTWSSWTPQLRATNSDVEQGLAPVGIIGQPNTTGCQFGFVVFPYAAMRTALTGATITSVSLQCTNILTYYTSGTLILGWSTRTSWGSSLTPSSATDHINSQQVGFSLGQAKSVGLLSWANAFATTATSLFIGDNTSGGFQYLTDWGAPATWTLTISYTK
jgi:hypothetical protein